MEPNIFRIRYKPCLGLTTANRITDPGLERLLVALSSYNQTNIKKYLVWKMYEPDLFHGLKVWGEASVATEDFLVDYRSHREAIEAVGECFP